MYDSGIMKKIIPFLLLLFAGSFAINAQIVKTPAARELAHTETLITSMQKEVVEAQKLHDELLQKYSPEYVRVKQLEERLVGLNQMKSVIEERRKVLRTQPLKVAIPTTDQGLLRILVMQNEQVIDLLERLVSNPLK